MKTNTGNLSGIFLDYIDRQMDSMYLKGNSPTKIKVWDVDEFSSIIFGENKNNITIYGLDVVKLEKLSHDKLLLIEVV